MGIAKGDKENYLNLYIALLNKEAIEDIISEKVEQLKWEHYHKGKQIDIFGLTISGKSIFVENQIDFASEKDRHIKSIGEIIEKAPHNSIIIWGAKDFSAKAIELVANMVCELKDKTIEFYAVEVNSSVLPILENLDNMHILHVMDNLKQLNAVDTYNDIFDKYVSSCKGISEKIEYKFERITDRERTNAYIINELRGRIKYPNIFREKRTIDTNKLRYGAGRTLCDFELVYSNRKGEAYVSCQFGNQTEDIYQEVAKRKTALEDVIGNTVVYDDENMRVVSFVEQFEHKFEKIDQLVELMDKYIFYLSNYTFYLGTVSQEQMWEKHREGLLET
ncbi:hypothetical protein [Fredinandcohnia quinoae]|uniref:DUF4268 domain-containing protein n=1 Tax=Fredinandcohnia quinoae TaxID=2918902 RepID=A0AAW5EBH2_9BACI|nr:hypothetical protein [Fredinandcohnia sp. SECRCQ15]MCH1627232.1 hypothetical protein [Fredinandcohnia sp. SECRCQ15]